MNIILLGLIVINALISYKAINNTSFFRKYEFHIGSIKSGEQLRILSSGFLHVDFQHLFFNMFTLYFFAPYVIYNTSALYFLYIYMGSLIAGNLLTFYFHKNDYSYRAVGASGAVTGIIFSAILLEPNIRMYGLIPGYIFGFAYLLFSRSEEHTSELQSRSPFWRSNWRLCFYFNKISAINYYRTFNRWCFISSNCSFIFLTKDE